MTAAFWNTHVRDNENYLYANAGSAVWPVGSIFISVSSTNPGTLLGFGIWTAFGTGRTLVGIDTGQTEFDTVQETGGSKTHTHSVPGLSVPGLSVPGLAFSGTTSGGGGSRPVIWQSNDGVAEENHTHPFSGTTSGGTTGTGTTLTGTSGSPSAVPFPYIVTYMWRRDS